MRRASAERLSFERQLDASHAQPIASREIGAAHLLVIDEDAVGARQILDLNVPVGRGQAAMHTGNQRRVDNKIGPGRAADGLDGAGPQPKRCFRTLQNPHRGLFYQPLSTNRRRIRHVQALVSAFLFDCRDALRGLRRDHLYSATVVATLALTIGAAAAVFSIVDGVLLKPLQYRDPGRLVILKEIWREASRQGVPFDVNERHFEYWREHARSFESMAQYMVLPANLTGAGEAAQIAVARTSGSLFDVLRVPAAAGRMLTPADEGRDQADVVVLSDRLLSERFKGDASIVGRSITLDGRPRLVVGVLPPDLRLPERGRLTTSVDAFVPLRVDVGWVGEHNDDAIGRLRPGVSADAARAELDVLQRQVSNVATKEAHEPVTLSSAVIPLAEAMVARARRGLALLFGAIIAVLLIACSNLANLTLTRSSARARDTAIRSALGADRSRLVSRALLEQGILAFVGGALGLWVAWAALVVFVRTAPLELPRVDEVTVDRRVVAFAATVSMLSALVVAAMPAWRTAAREVQAALRLGGAATTADRGGFRTRAVLLTLQVALSVMLLVVTGLLSASFVRLISVDRGFNSDHLLAIDVSFPASRYGDEAPRQQAYRRLIEAIGALPAVEQVTTTSMLPMTGTGSVNFIATEGSTRPRSEQPSASPSCAAVPSPTRSANRDGRCRRSFPSPPRRDCGRGSILSAGGLPARCRANAASRSSAWSPTRARRRSRIVRRSWSTCPTGGELAPPPRWW